MFQDLDKNKEPVLKFISEIKNDCQFLNYLHKEGKIQDIPNSKVQSIIDWSHQMEQQIDYMTVRMMLYIRIIIDIVTETSSL